MGPFRSPSWHGSSCGSVPGSIVHPSLHDHEGVGAPPVRGDLDARLNLVQIRKGIGRRPLSLPVLEDVALGRARRSVNRTAISSGSANRRVSRPPQNRACGCQRLVQRRASDRDPFDQQQAMTGVLVAGLGRDQAPMLAKAHDCCAPVEWTHLPVIRESCACAPLAVGSAGCQVRPERGVAAAQITSRP